MYRQIGEPLVCAFERATPYEVGGQHPVPTLARNVVNAINREKQPPRKESEASRCADRRSTNHRSVLGAVASEKMSG